MCARFDHVLHSTVVTDLFSLLVAKGLQLRLAAKSRPLPVFLNQVYWNTDTPILSVLFTAVVLISRRATGM